MDLKMKTLSVAALLWLSAGSTFSQAPATKIDNSHFENAVLWQQSSGERNALSYQAFALARMLLDRDLRTQRGRMRRAVIVDVDETVLDNSRYQARLIKEGKSYPEGWTDWINSAQCSAVPGAVEFLNYANSRGVRVFYVTNRKLIEKDGTARNLTKLGFPRVTDETLLVRTDEKNDSKEPRRKAVGSRYRVVLLVGDDLNDFSEVFEKSRTITSRMAAAEELKGQFGKRFIVLPNPMYGNWENSLYEYNFKLTPEEKAQKRRNALKD
jgi:5'-nucleotidase (lipoprotein e(P4) family)